MKPLRVLALVHEDLVPPDDPGDADVLAVPWKTEFDVVSTLREMGHEVRPLGVRSDLRVVREVIEEWQPHIAFNLLEEFDGVATYDQNVVAYLELLRVPYTGCNPRGLMLSRDKALSKKVLAYHRIPCPDFAVFPLGRAARRPRRLSFPLIVKSLTEDASLGISQASVVENDDKLRERVAFIHESLGTSAIVERYIEGRELYVSVVGNRRLSVFPVWELRMEGLPDEARPDRDPAAQVEPALPEEVRDPVGRGARPARPGRPPGPGPGQADLPHARPQRIRAHRLPPGRQPGDVRARGEPQSRDRVRRGAGRVGGEGRPVLRGAPPADPEPRAPLAPRRLRVRRCQSSGPSGRTTLPAIRCVTGPRSAGGRRTSWTRVAIARSLAPR